MIYDPISEIDLFYLHWISGLFVRAERATMIKFSIISSLPRMVKNEHETDIFNYRGMWYICLPRKKNNETEIFN